MVRTARLQRPRTSDAWLSGHLDHPGRMDASRVDTGRPDTGRPDTGRLDTGRPPDQVDGRRSAWRTADADSATNGVAGVRTSCVDGHDDGDAGWATQTSLGLQRLGARNP